MGNDERLIQLGIEAARAEDREVDNAVARAIAAQLHGGQGSALYSLASTGNLADERLERELRVLYQDPNPLILEQASVLGTYAVYRNHRGTVEGWAELTADRPREAERELGVLMLNHEVERPGKPAEQDIYPWNDAVGWLADGGGPDELDLK